MNRCPACGTVYSSEAKFCPRDGARLVARLTTLAGGAGGAAPRPAQADRPATLGPDPGGLATGDRVDGRYEVERKLGQGGMSFVYLVRDLTDGSPRAIKVLSANLSTDAKAMARLRREAGFGMRLAHPNVCHILHVGETEAGLVYVVMPYLEGEILSDRTFRRGQLPLDEVVRHVRDIAAGLQRAHELGIIHRDLKPENVMISPTADGGERAVVLDFGLAKERTVLPEVQKLTATGIVLGTPEFMSPEQIRGRPLDGRSDVYALALMTFELLTGRLPFTGGTPQEVMIARLRGSPMTIRELRPDLDVPGAVDRAIGRGLALDPKDRFSGAVEFATALERAAAGREPEREEGWRGRLFRRRDSTGEGG